MRILFLSPNQIDRYNWGHQLFRNEIGKQHKTTYYGEGFPNFNSDLSVKDIVKKVYGNSKPDLIMTYGWRYTQGFKGFEEVDIPKAHIVVDYGREQGIQKQDNFHRKNKYSLLFAISRRAGNLLSKNTPEIPVRIIPFSVDTNVYKPMNMKKEDIVLAAFSSRPDIYPNRRKIIKALNQLGVRKITAKIIHNRLIRAINMCKITVTSNNIFSSLSMRYTETLACGGFLLSDEPDDLSYVGLEDKKHLVLYKDLNDFKKKVLYFLDPKNESERLQIAKQGMKFVRNNHSCEIRVKQMTKYIKEVLGI